MRASIDGARLNFSHGTHEDHAETRALDPRRAGRGRRPVALIADLQGPKLRIGELAAPVVLERGEDVTIAGEDARAAATCRSRPPCSARCSSPATTC